jgi:hypothetical protein
MAGTGTRVIEDGVHLIKLDDSPPVLNPDVYHLYPAEDVVVDGNQFYWVRIGSVRAEGLSKNDIAKFLCYGAFIVVGVAVSIYGGSVVAASETTITTVSIATEVGVGGATIINIIQRSPGSIKKYAIEGITGTLSGILGLVSGVCEKVETYFVNNKFGVVASDGTILICIDKNNVMGIQELKKSGIDISNLAHLTTGGQMQTKQKQEL